MIVGEGLLARAFLPLFNDDSDVIVFASGVSNSLETRHDEFAREASLLRYWLAREARRFIYFSSCGVAAAESEQNLYMRHKRLMESLVLSTPQGLVIRLPQVVGTTANQNTLANFLRDRIVSGEHFTVWARAERNLIDVDDVVKIAAKLASRLPAEESTVSIASTRSLLMPEIVRIFERSLDRTANCTHVNKGVPLSIDTTIVRRLGVELDIDLGAGYIEHVIQKYYPANQSCEFGDISSTSASSI